jgi:hypothetical protein
MRNRTGLSLLIVALLLSSMIPTESTTQLKEQAMSFADSEPVLLITEGSSAGHVNASHIAAVPGGWIIADDTRTALTFGQTTLTANSPYNSNYPADSYIAKMDSTGAWQWAAQPDCSNGLIFIDEISTTIMGETLVVGLYAGAVSFGATQLANPSPYGDGFVAMLDQTGQWKWAHGFETTSNNNSETSRIFGVTSTLAGDIWVTGSHKGETNFGSSTITSTNTSYFLAKMDAMNGANTQVFAYGGSGTNAGSQVAADSMGNVWVVGTTTGTFDTGNKIYTTGSSGDTIIVKNDPNGAVLDVYGMSSSFGNQNIPFDLAIDINDDLLISGYFSDVITLSQTQTMTDSGNGDGYLVKFLKTGTFDWYKSIGSSGSQEFVQSVDVLSSGDVIISSFISGSINIGPDVLTATGGASDGDIYLAQLDSAGNWQWSERLGGTSFDIPGSMAVNQSDFIGVSGSYQNSITKGSQTITSSAGLDLFVWIVDPIMNQDADADGVADHLDNCPTDNNPLQYDSDGDSDGDECDYDDDNDGITDNSGDDCPRGGAWNWTSDSTTDFDNDGCKDDVEDSDDDNDGVEDVNDMCVNTAYDAPRNWWVSTTENDIDGDGCRDADEDSDDDDDGFSDSADDCSKISGYSTLGSYQGCPDTDGDGWADIEDTCVDSSGNSTLGGSIGCPDQDGDGWSDDDDDLPQDPTQWLDSDDDGYGDNMDGNNPDSCPSITGTSILDRFGCLDLDSDGYSSPDDVFLIIDGADAFPSDSTQWADWDEDGYGDNWGNSSWTDRTESWPGEFYSFAKDQDYCPLQEGTSYREEIYGCPDSDADGWANFMDAFPFDADEHLDDDDDGFANGNDACPDDWGNSTEDRQGCIDSDGDGYSDPFPGTWEPADGADAFPMDSAKWIDSDNDRYDDNFDDCPAVYGTSELGGEVGCPDRDGDLYSDAIDAFPDDLYEWNDTDGDGVGDRSDECPDIAGDDSDGCLIITVDQTASSSLVTYGGIGGGIILLIVIIGLVIAKRGGKDETDWSQQSPDKPAMPNMNAKPAMPDMFAQSAQPVQPVQPAYSMPVQPAYSQPEKPVYQAVQPVLMAAAPAVPTAPTIADVGSMRADGNEWLEFPEASGAWYARDPATRQWVRKI